MAIIDKDFFIPGDSKANSGTTIIDHSGESKVPDTLVNLGDLINIINLGENPLIDNTTQLEEVHYGSHLIGVAGEFFPLGESPVVSTYNIKDYNLELNLEEINKSLLATIEYKNNKIVAKNKKGDILGTISAEDLISTGLINKIDVVDNDLVIQYGVDKQVSVPLSKLFDTSLYYTKLDENPYRVIRYGADSSSLVHANFNDSYYVNGDPVSTANGYGAISLGYRTNADGYLTTVFGEENTATNDYSVVFGFYNTVESLFSLVQGNSNEVKNKGEYLFVFGLENYANSSSSSHNFIFGNHNRLYESSAYNLIFGLNIIANKQSAHNFVFGNNINVAESKKYNSAFGYSHTVKGDYTFLAGQGLTTTKNYEIALGRCNESGNNTIFSIGNGSSTSSRSNVFEIQSDGSLIVKPNISIGSGNDVSASIGTAIAIGFVNECIYNGSIAIGRGNISGSDLNLAISFGFENDIHTHTSLGIGWNNNSGDFSTSTMIGYQNTCEYLNGNRTRSLGPAILVGADNTADNGFSVTMGYNNTTVYEYGINIGNDNVIGDKNNYSSGAIDYSSIVIGNDLRSSDGQIILGHYNKTSPALKFCIGDGTSSKPSNLFGIDRNGSIIFKNGISFNGNLIIETTYNNLVTSADSGLLTPGMKYRITDYVTIISNSTNITAFTAGHAFDIIVTAIDTGHLDENAIAVRHSGDTYFPDEFIATIKYDINNDTDKYEWADDYEGKGVIYWMKDAYDNEYPYDFKNIKFQYAELDSTSNRNGSVYAFDCDGTDYSLTGKVRGNIVKACYQYDQSNKLILNAVVLCILDSVLSGDTIEANYVGFGCNNIFLKRSTGNTFGAYCNHFWVTQGFMISCLVGTLCLNIYINNAGIAGSLFEGNIMYLTINYSGTRTPALAFIRNKKFSRGIGGEQNDYKAITIFDSDLSTVLTYKLSTETAINV